MGACTSVSYDVYSPSSPAALPGSEDDLKELTNVTLVHSPGTEDYEFSRKDRTWYLDPVAFGRPSAIAVPKNAEQVAAIVKYAARTGAKLSIACGRHTDESIIQDALMIDMSHGMDAVFVDVAAKTITVQGGATIGKVDTTCAPHGFILPMGRLHTTGCAGQMITTGAHAYCERRYGLGIDYMIAATVVVGTGEILTCSATENPDLFWAVRGGGTVHVGVIVDMTFKVIVAPNGGKFYSGSYVYLPTGLFGMPTRQTVMDSVLQAMDVDRPREYSASVTFIAGGISPGIVSHFWFGDEPAAGKEYIQKNCPKVGVCVANTMGEHDYWSGIQRFSVGPKGDQAGPAPYYYKGVMPHKFTAEMGKLIVDALNATVPKGVQPLVIMDLMGGKSEDVPVTDTALPSRNQYWVVFLATWKPEQTGPAGREAAVKWVDDLWTAFCTLNNHLAVDGTAALTASDLQPATLRMGQQGTGSGGEGGVWGANESRLVATKARYDPNNVFGAHTSTQ